MPISANRRKSSRVASRVLEPSPVRRWTWRILTAWATAILALGVAAASAAPALASGWSIQSTPNPSGGGALNAVSCLSPPSVACFAVGASSTDTALAEEWNGSPWTIQTTPTTPNGVGSLNAVSCTSADACIAVGSMGTLSLAEQWNGTAWTIQPTPYPGGSKDALTGVSCTSASACTAVGWYVSATSPTVSYQTVAERWNGSAWTIQPSTPGALDAVSCTSASNCMAVGWLSVIGCGPRHCRIYQAIAEQWNGTSWALVNSGLPARGSPVALTAVSCTGTSACTGIGYLNGSAFAADWNGSSWTIASTPNPSGAGGSTLNGVSCTSASACTAVGDYDNSSGTTLTLAEAWNGSSWTIASTPSPSASTINLASVSCTTSTACTAVGNYTDSSGTTLTLAAGYSG